MDVKSIRDEIATWQTDGKLNGQNVEFILGTKKFFISDVKAGTDTMLIEVTRKFFKNFSVESLSSVLRNASGHLNVSVKNLDSNANTTVDKLYLSNDHLEIITA